MKYLVVFLVAVICSCQTKQTLPDGVQRSPDSTNSGWQEIIADKPETFLDTKDSLLRLKTRQQKTLLLQQCGVTFLTSQDILETDLLFIRIENWPLERLIKEYESKTSAESLRCLQNASFSGV